MTQFDERIMRMAAQEEMVLPSSLESRLCEICTATNQKRLPVARIVLIAAAVSVVMAVTASAAGLITWADMRFFGAEHVTLEDGTEFALMEDSHDPSKSVEEIDSLTNQYDALYKDADKQAAAMEAAERAYTELELRDSALNGSRFEIAQFDYQADVPVAMVVLYLEDGCGYRMILNADTLDVVRALPLTPDVMADEYFSALWDGTAADYIAREAENAAG